MAKDVPMANEIQHAVVIHPHADYKRGDVVTDPKAVEDLLRDHPAQVVKIIPGDKKAR